MSFLDKTGLARLWANILSIIPTKTSQLENDTEYISITNVNEENRLSLPEATTITSNMVLGLHGDTVSVSGGSGSAAINIDFEDTITVTGDMQVQAPVADESVANKKYVDEALSENAVFYIPQTLTEEQQLQARTNIGAVSEEDVIDIIANGTEQQVNATGDLIDFNFEKETPITVISKIHRDSTWGLSNELVLHQVKGNNFADFTAYLGGAGKVFEKNGLTATINDNSTLTVQGTNTSTGWTGVISVTRWTGEHSARIYPAGTYTIPSGFMMAVRAATYPDDSATIPGATGNLSGTITISEPFRIVSIGYTVKGGATVDTTVPLGLFRGRSIPETNYEYCGKIYTTTFDHPVYDGEFNWTTGELKDKDGNTVGYYETPEIIGMEGDNHFWTGFGENIITNLQEKEKILIQLNEIVPEGSIPSICDFTFKPNTPLCVYSLSDENILVNSKFNGKEIPMATTTGNLTVLDSDNNIKFKKQIDSMIGVNRDTWNVFDTLNENGLYKAWSKKFYLTMDSYASREDSTYDGGATNSLYTFEFNEADFAETGIPAKLDNIPVATPCFYTGNNIDNWLPSRVYGGQPFPLKFSYNQETGKYIMTIKGFGAGLIFHQLTNYSKTYIYYQLETPYYEKNFLAMGLEEGDKITFENDYSELQEYLDTPNFFKNTASGDFPITSIDTTPSLSTVVPLNTKNALIGFANAAKIFNEGQSSDGDNIAQDYSWIGDGDGVTDYTSTIQNKIKDLSTISKGGTVFLGNGVYNISKNIEVYDNIKIIGTGNTVIQQTNKYSHTLVISGSNITIKDVKLSLYTMTAEEKDSLDYNTELTACLYINSCNDPNYDSKGYNDKYPKNMYCQNLIIDNVYLVGCYGFRWIDGKPVISNDYEHYRGCGLIQERLFFNYATITNLHISGMYHGLHGCGGSNDVTIFCTSTKIMAYGGGGYTNLNIYGHSYYETDANGNTISMSDAVGEFTDMEQSYITEYIYDYQWIKNVFIFSGRSMNNRYLISQIAGTSYYGNDISMENNVKLEHLVLDYGRGNRGVENFQNTPFHIGTKYRDKTEQSMFKACDPITQNVLSGAGIWGSITSNDTFNKGRLPLSDICRYPTDSNVTKHPTVDTEFLYALSENTPTEENPIEIVIDVSNRPIFALPGAFIQFFESNIASDFTVSFDFSNNNVFTSDIVVKDNIDYVWYFFNHQDVFKKIYKIKIVITKALYIEKLEYQNSGYVDYEMEYNPERKIGICNVGMIDTDFAGRAFLGECGGNVYGDLNLYKDSTIKNVPTPVEDGDAVNKEYVDNLVNNSSGSGSTITKVSELENDAGYISTTIGYDGNPLLSLPEMTTISSSMYLGLHGDGVSITDSGNTSSIILDGMGGAQLNGDFHVQTPVANASIANKKYVDDAIAGIDVGGGSSSTITSIGDGSCHVTAATDSVSISAMEIVTTGDVVTIGSYGNSIFMTHADDNSDEDFVVTGDMHVQTPIKDNSVANKKYVDDQIAALMAKIQELLASI